MFFNSRKITSTISILLHQKNVYYFAVRVRFETTISNRISLEHLRVAYYNYLFAKRNHGALIFRVSDQQEIFENVKYQIIYLQKKQHLEQKQNQKQTQQQKKTIELKENKNEKERRDQRIKQMFKQYEWFGIVPDESVVNNKQIEANKGPYIKSQRLNIYKNYEKALLKSNLAYPCFCHQPHHQATQSGSHAKQMYDGRCKKLSLTQIKQNIEKKLPFSIRIKSNILNVSTSNANQNNKIQLNDFIIMKSNGWPTDIFATVIDDFLMKITHVFTEEVLLKKFHQQLFLYKLLKFQHPKVVFLPSMKYEKNKSEQHYMYLNSLINYDYERIAIKNYLFRIGVHLEEKVQDSQEKPPEIVAENQKKQDNNYHKKQQRKQQKAKEEIENDFTIYTEKQMLEHFMESKISKRIIMKYHTNHFFLKLNKAALDKSFRQITGYPAKKQYFLEKIHKYIPNSRNYDEKFIFQSLAFIIEKINVISDVQKHKYLFEKPNYKQKKSLQDFNKLFSKDSMLSLLDNGNVVIKGVNEQQLVSEYPLGLKLDGHIRNKKIYHIIRMIFEHLIIPEAFTEENIAKKISEYLIQEKEELTNQDVYDLLKWIITGTKHVTQILKVCLLLGRQETIARIRIIHIL